QWEPHPGETLVPLKLEARGSCFVVFRETQAGFDPVLKVTRDGQAAPEAQLDLGAEGNLDLLAARDGTYECLTACCDKWKSTVTSLPASAQIRGPWEVRFAPKLGAPEQSIFPKIISWAKHSDPGNKYFSGQATYRKRITLPPEFCGARRRVRLSLG